MINVSRRKDNGFRKRLPKNTNSDESFKKLVHYNAVIYKLSMAYYMNIRSFYSIYLGLDFNLLQEKYSDGEDVIEAIKEQVLEEDRHLWL